MTTNSARNLFRAALLLALFVLITLGAHDSFAQTDKWGAWENGITESWWLSSSTFTYQEAEAAIARWKLIGPADRPAALDRWEGDYFRGGETHGTYVRWSSAGFVIVDVDKCQALVMGVTYGRVNVTGSRIQFTPEFSKTSKSHAHATIAREPATMSFIPVRWRSELYLIPEDSVGDFADYVAGLGDFNGLHGFSLENSFFYTRDAAELAAASFPFLPREYQRFLKPSITAKIIAIEGKELRRNYSDEFKSSTLSFTTQHHLASLTFVRINIGTIHGARKGLFLRISKPDLGEKIRIVSVGKTSSRGVLVRDLDKGRETYFDDAQRERVYPKAVPGWALTTALH